jgi:hypothetical protein
VTISLQVRRGILIFALALTAYGVRAGDLLRHESIAPYFTYLADAFGHGAVNIEHPPAWGYDLIRYDGRWYVAQQPLPALLLTPVVSVLGRQRVSDVAFGVLCGAISVMLGDWVIGITSPDVSPERRNWLTLFLALGTAHFSLSVLGTVWFLGQIVTLMFVWIFIGALWRDKPLIGGIGLAMMLLGRPSIVPGALLLAVGIIRLHCPPLSTKQRSIFWSQLFIPLLASGIFLGCYNWVRFGNPLDMGYLYIQEAADIKERLLQYGNFNLAFLPENLSIATIKPPIFQPDCGAACELIQPDPVGMGLLWTSPVLLYGVLALRQKGKRHEQNVLVAVIAGLALLPSLLYHNPGSAQFGYRFMLDALPFWMILVARGVKNQRPCILAALVLYCVGVNLWGTNWLIDFIT